MADETTYEGEMNQAVHRPGMEGAVNRGARADARDASGNRTSAERPTVGAGHVDPFSIKGDPAPASAPKAAAPRPDDGSGTGGRSREAVIMGNADKAVTG